jgi:hypothetical protein
MLVMHGTAPLGRFAVNFALCFVMYRTRRQHSLARPWIKSFAP